MNQLFKKAMRWETALGATIVLEFLVFSIINPHFADTARILHSMSDFIYLGIAALPLAIIMLSGGIDISFGSIASLSAITAGVVYITTNNMTLGILIALIAGLACGLVNGLLITLTGSVPMVITLGTQFLFAGLALGVSGLGGVSSFEGISGLPSWFNALTNGRFLGIPKMLLIFIIFALIFLFVIEKTTFGRQIRLIGVNAEAARYAGFRSNKLLITAYSLMGLTAGIVGILLTSYVGSARPDVGIPLLMPVLTLVVIGGISMNGGEGTILGVIIATFVVGFLQQGLRFSGLNENEVAVATGIALVAVASLRWWTITGSEKYRNRKAQKTLSNHPNISSQH